MSKMVTKFMPAQYVNSNTNQLQDLTGILGKEILSAGEIGSNENSNLSRCANGQHWASPLSGHQGLKYVKNISSRSKNIQTETTYNLFMTSESPKI